MNKSSLRILFMGTPDFAVGILRALVENDYNVVAVVTMPDKPMGRHGSVLRPSAVKQYALSVGLPVLQPVKLRDEEFLASLRTFEAHLQIVVAFRMLPEVVWAMPPFGTINLHASLLPQYRGAAPINWAIIHGDKETGVTTFFLQHDIDTGAIIRQERIPIRPEDNAETIHDCLMQLGANVVMQTVDDIIAGTVIPVPQDQFLPIGSVLLPAPKLFKDNTRICWDNPASEIHNFIRGLSPYPTAWTSFRRPDGYSVDVKVFATKVEEGNMQPGTLDSDHRTFLYIGTTKGVISILNLQLAGKRRMDIADFLRGHADITDWVAE